MISKWREKEGLRDGVSSIEPEEKWQARLAKHSTGYMITELLSFSSCPYVPSISTLIVEHLRSYFSYIDGK